MFYWKNSSRGVNSKLNSKNELSWVQKMDEFIETLSIFKFSMDIFILSALLFLDKSKNLYIARIYKFFGQIEKIIWVKK